MLVWFVVSQVFGFQLRVLFLIYCVAFVELRLTCRQSNDTGHLSMSGLGNNNPQCQTIDEAPKSNLTLSLTFSSENFETQVAIDGSQWIKIYHYEHSVSSFSQIIIIFANLMTDFSKIGYYRRENSNFHFQKMASNFDFSRQNIKIRSFHFRRLALCLSWNFEFLCLKW